MRPNNALVLTLLSSWREWGVGGLPATQHRASR